MNSEELKGIILCLKCVDRNKYAAVSEFLLYTSVYMREKEDKVCCVAFYLHLKAMYSVLSFSVKSVLYAN